MGWTERIEIKRDYEDILTYLEAENSFHDYRIGNVYYDGVNADITVEEAISGARTAESAGLIWDFHFRNVTFFEMSADVVMGFWIMEVERGEKSNEMVFNLDSGFIRVVADTMELGIPSAKKSEK